MKPYVAISKKAKKAARLAATRAGKRRNTACSQAGYKRSSFGTIQGAERW